ncbi:MAG TPA: hypothetical protein VM452_13520 [Caulifigura sp.]|nr:hypothetical protein [Caulifigura sp.]
MSALWYWKSNGRIRGPLVTEELEAIVLNRRLQDADQVRLDGSEEWLSAAEIHGMFSGRSESPAATAAKLLETAAARRLQGGTSGSDSAGARGLSRLAGIGGSLIDRLVELASRLVRSVLHWLGRRGRLLVTVLAGTAVIGFFASRLDWRDSDSVRLYRLESVWREMRKGAGAASSETATWLEQTEQDLERALKESPVSGSSGRSRRTALARREMLFAVRELRGSPPFEDDEAKRIDQSLRSAGDYLAVSPSAPAEDSRPGTRDGNSSWIMAILVVDSLLVVAGATWWVMKKR